MQIVIFIKLKNFILILRHRGTLVKKDWKEISDFVNGKNINQQTEEKNSKKNNQQICTKATLNMCWIVLTNNSGILPPEECYEMKV